MSLPLDGAAVKPDSLPMASVAQLPIIQQIVAWLVDVASTSVTATIYEHVAQGYVVDHGFTVGWRFCLNKGTPLREVSVVANKVREAPAQLVAGDNSDLRVAAPTPLIAELKIRGTFGSSVTRPIQHYDDEFTCVVDGNSDVFFLVADALRYDALRAGGAAITFADELPPRLDIGLAAPTEHVVQRDGASARVVARRCVSSMGERVVVAFYLPTT